MKRITLLLVLLIAGCAPTSQNRDPLNLLILGRYEGGTDNVSEQRILRAAQRGLARQMQANGHRVYDESHLRNSRFDGRQSDAEMIDIARSATQPPMDAVLIFTVDDRVQRQRLKVRIRGRLLQVHSGRRLGNGESKRPERAIPSRCSSACLSELLAEESNLIANDLGAVLAAQLAPATSRSGESGSDSSRSRAKPSEDYDW